MVQRAAAPGGTSAQPRGRPRSRQRSPEQRAALPRARAAVARQADAAACAPLALPARVGGPGGSLAGGRRRVAPTMGGKVTNVVKLELQAGKASPSPPVGPALGSKGVNIMAFCKEYNAQTAEQEGQIVPVEITIFEDKSFSFVLRTPPTSELLKNAAGVKKGSGTPPRTIVASVSQDQVREIATTKLPDLNTNDLDTACQTVAGTARNMGIRVKESE